jgi:hypothetical protein
MLRFTFLMLVAVSFRPRFIISPKRSTFLPFRSAKMGARSRLPHLVLAWPRCLLLAVADGL